MENLNYYPEKTFLLSSAVDYAEEGIVSRIIAKNKGGNITLFAFDRGQQLSEHTAPFDAMVLGLEGEGSVIIGGKEHILAAGEALILPANIPHSVNALTRFKMLLIMLREIG